ncbi:MAG: DUF1961 family protein [Oscillospiraceae bacterium]|nr:DUF1961 family protein [Oscillospiraceae bacterium]
MQKYTQALIYTNPLCQPEDIADFIEEGSLKTSFVNKCLRIESVRSPKEEQKANYVLWCNRVFPHNIKICWQFKPVQEPGLAMMFWAAKAKNGESIFAPGLMPRTGEYQQYHHSDINAYHLSYFRRKEPDERIFHTCNLRKSYGLHLVSQGADPIPEAASATQFYDMCITQFGADITFTINGLEVLHYVDDETYGAVLGGGHIGFRQLAPFCAEYKNLQVYQLLENES